MCSVCACCYNSTFDNLLDVNKMKDEQIESYLYLFGNTMCCSVVDINNQLNYISIAIIG